jgi:hypothetical protein
MSIRHIEVTEAKPASAPIFAPASVSQSGKAAHDATVNQAELARQNAVAAAGSNQTTVRSAEVQFYKTVTASALANGVSPSAAMQALRELGQTGI